MSRKLNEIEIWSYEVSAALLSKLDNKLTASGGPYLNISTLRSELTSKVTPLLTSLDTYKNDLNGSILSSFKSLLMSLYTFASMKYSVVMQGSPEIQNVIPASGVFGLFGYTMTNLPEPAVYIEWLDWEETIDELTFLPSGNGILKVSADGAAITSFISNANSNYTSTDISTLESLSSNIGNGIKDRVLFQMFASPQMTVTDKSPRDIVMIDFKLNDLLLLQPFNSWVLHGITQ